MPYADAPGYAQGVQTGAAEDLQNLIGRQQQANIAATGAQTRQTQEANYWTSVNPQQIQNLHPRTKQFIQGVGRPQTDGSLQIPRDLMPKLQDLDMQMHNMDLKVARENQIKHQIESDPQFRNPNTGLPDFSKAPEIGIHYANLGQGQMNEGDLDKLASLMQIRSMSLGQEGRGVDPYSDARRRLEVGTSGVKSVETTYPPHEMDTWVSQASQELGKPGQRHYASADNDVIQRAIQLKRDDDNRRMIATRNQININAADVRAQGPVPMTQMGNYFNPNTKMFAANDPLMRGADIEKLQASGYLNTAAWGTSKDMVKELQNVSTATEHLSNVDQFIDRNPDLFPQWDPQQQVSSVAKAKLQQAWAGMATHSDPRYAELEALDRAAVNIYAAVTPTTGNRYGYQIAKYVGESLPNPGIAMSAQGAHAAVNAWRNSIGAAAAGRLTPVQGIAPRAVAPQPLQNRPQVAPQPGSAEGNVAVTNSNFAQWKNKRQ